MTWSRDSHGLYDYESRSVQKKLIQVTKPCVLTRLGTEVSQTLSQFDMQQANEIAPLCHIDPVNTDFTVQGCSDTMWMVIRTMRTKYGPGYLLKEGDTIKLGRVCYKVSLLRSHSDDSLSDKTQDSDESDVEIPNERETGVCRICLNNDSETANPLISPCKCAGSMKYIHLLCLRQWLNSRMQSRVTENCVTYSWKSIDCEICKSCFPFSIGNTGKETELFKIQKPETPFIVLEGVGNDKNSNRGVHIVSVTNGNDITLGRGHEADVRISDISVSRCHATLKFVDGRFLIEDNNSKFGTLVSVCEKIVIKPLSSVVVQIGRTVISFSTRVQQQGIDSNDITN